MIEVFSQAAEAKVHLDDVIKVNPDDKVSGSGILQDLTDGDALPLRDLVMLMITLSDNTATNLILNRVGGNAVNARMAALGLKEHPRDAQNPRRWQQVETHPSGITDEGAKPENKKWGLRPQQSTGNGACCSKSYIAANS